MWLHFLLTAVLLLFKTVHGGKEDEGTVVKHPLPTPNLAQALFNAGLHEKSMSLWALGDEVHIGSLYDARKMSFLTETSAFINKVPDDQLVIRVPSHESFESIGLVEKPSDFFKLFNFPSVQALGIQTGQIRMMDFEQNESKSSSSSSSSTSNIIKAFRKWLSSQSLEGGWTNPARLLKDTEPFNYWLRYVKTAEEYLDLGHPTTILDIDYQSLDPEVSTATHVVIGMEIGAGVVVRSQKIQNKNNQAAGASSRTGKSSAFFESPEIFSDIPLSHSAPPTKSHREIVRSGPGLKSETFSDLESSPTLDEIDEFLFEKSSTTPSSTTPSTTKPSTTKATTTSQHKIELIPIELLLSPGSKITSSPSNSPLLSAFKTPDFANTRGLDLSQFWPFNDADADDDDDDESGAGARNRRQVTTTVTRKEMDQLDPYVRDLMDQFQEKINSTSTRHSHTKPLIYTLISVHDFVNLVTGLDGPGSETLLQQQQAPPIFPLNSTIMDTSAAIFDGIALVGNRLNRLLQKMQLSVDSVSYEDLAAAEILQRKFFKTSRNYARDLREVMLNANDEQAFETLFKNYRNHRKHSFEKVNLVIDSKFREATEKIRLHEWIFREQPRVKYLGRHSSIEDVQFSQSGSSGSNNNETYLLFFKDLTSVSKHWPWLQKRSAFFNLLRDNPTNAGRLYVVDCNFAFTFDTCDDLTEPVIHVYHDDELYSTTFPLTQGQVPPVEGGCQIIASGVGDKDIIMNRHNELRKKVATGQEKRGNPGPQPAGEIRDLTWNLDLAKTASLWAGQCKFAYDKLEDRRTDEYPDVGQNVIRFNKIISSSNRPTGPLPIQWERAITGWYDKVEVFDSENVESFEHSKGDSYAQLVWAETTEVGCGYAQYEDKNQKGETVVSSLYVCNYGPKGNKRNNQVYKIAISEGTTQSSVKATE